jgi:hypothetical protein
MYDTLHLLCTLIMEILAGKAEDVGFENGVEAGKKQTYF